MKHSLSLLLPLLLAISSLAADLKPTKDLGVIHALVTDFDGKVYKGEEIEFFGQRTQQKASAKSDREGRFSLHIPKGDTYDILFQSLTGPYKCGEISVPLKATTANLNVQFESNVLELRDVLFETGKADLKPGPQKMLDGLVTGMKKQDTLKIEIAGHTDNVGGEEYNKELSLARANTVRDYIVLRGVQAERVTANGYGFDQPVADNDSESGRALNRRIEVRILNLKRE